MIDSEILLIIIAALIGLATTLGMLGIRQVIAEIRLIQKDNSLQWRTIGRIDRQVAGLRGRAGIGGD